jgi:hypothetical protein
MRKEEEEEVVIIINKGKRIRLQKKLMPIRLLLIFMSQIYCSSIIHTTKFDLPRITYTMGVKVTRAVLFALRRSTTQSHFISTLLRLSKTVKYCSDSHTFPAYFTPCQTVSIPTCRH